MIPTPSFLRPGAALLGLCAVAGGLGCVGASEEPVGVERRECDGDEGGARRERDGVDGRIAYMNDTSVLK